MRVAEQLWRIRRGVRSQRRVVCQWLLGWEQIDSIRREEWHPGFMSEANGCLAKVYGVPVTVVNIPSFVGFEHHAYDDETDAIIDTVPTDDRATRPSK